MRIAILTNQYPTTTSPNMAFVHTRARAYRDYGHNVQVWAQNLPELPMLSELDGINISRQSVKETICEIHKFDPDVLAVHSPYKWSIEISKQIKRPTVVWIHGWESLLGWPYYYYVGWKQKIVESLADIRKLLHLRKYLQCCSTIVYVSNWMRRISQQFTLSEGDKSYIIPNPVDIDLFQPNNCLVSNSRRGLSVRDFHVNKYGLDVAINAYSGVKSTNLTIIGTGQLATWFQSQIVKCNSTTNLIQQHYLHESLPAVYRDYQYFVAPSRVESHGISMCEAMACGLPVVASRVGGIPEFVEDGVEGFLVQPGKIKSLREAVLRMANLPKDEYIRMSANARQKVLATCAQENIIDRELDVLRLASEGKLHIQ